MRKRAIILSTAIIFGFVAVFLRLSDLMILNHVRLSQRADSQQIRKEEIQVRRGMIYDRKGRELGVNVEMESLYADPELLASPKNVAYSVSKVVGQRPETVLTRFSTKGRFVWIERKLTREKVEMIKAMDIKGLGFMSDAKRFYPKGRLASHVIGSVGVDNQALEGVELKYDNFLKKAGGKVIVARDGKGMTLSNGVELESKGNNIILTIDEGLQYIAERELDSAMVKWQASAATAIMMDPLTGNILALANRPAYDGNNFLRAKDYERRNRAITDCYEPGSTFKIIVGAAALEEKLVGVNTRLDCSKGGIEIGNHVIHDTHRNGILTFKEVIQKSSNVGSVMIGKRLGKEKIYKYAKLFGFGEKTGVDLPGEVSGLIKHPSKWSKTSLGAMAIGQEVAVTPLQVLRAYSAIANGGVLVTPHVVSEIKSASGELVYEFKPDKNQIAVSKKTAEVFKEILKTVAEEGGTGTSASVTGSKVAGKTGTSQIIDPKTRKYSKEKYVSSFVGFVPADNPLIALIVVVYEPKGQIYGGLVAAPVFKDIAKQSLSYMNVPADDESTKNIFVVEKK
jgi:cell division protein FtsI/penicillin-binding protein 2